MCANWSSRASVGLGRRPRVSRSAGANSWRPRRLRAFRRATRRAPPTSSRGSTPPWRVPRPHGLEPLLVVAHAPAFAEAPDRWPYAYLGSWAPNPAALEEFAAALARRYDGSFPDPARPGRALPRVRLLPGLERAEPGALPRAAVDRCGRPLESVLAAALPPAAERVLRRRQVCSARRRGGHRRCRSERRTRGRGAHGAGDVPARSAVPANSRPLLGPAALRRARLSPAVGRRPRPARPSSSLDVAISDAAKITGLLRQAERQHTALPAGRKPVWVTELNWESSPPASAGVPDRLQAPWISRALHRLWVAGVGLVDWQFLIDPYPAERASTPAGGTVEYQRPAGLYSAGAGGDPAGASPKPFLGGFTFPFDPLRVDRRHVRVWALLMRAYQPVWLQRQRSGGAWRTVAYLHASAGAVLNALVTLRGAANLRLVSAALTSASVQITSRRSLPAGPRRARRPPAHGSSRARPAR